MAAAPGRRLPNILCRTLITEEVAAVSRQRGHRLDTGYLVARIVHRRDLERAVAALA